MTATLPPARLKSMSRLSRSMREANLTRHHPPRRPKWAARNAACPQARAPALTLLTASPHRSARACLPKRQAHIPFSFH